MPGTVIKKGKSKQNNSAERKTVTYSHRVEENKSPSRLPSNIYQTFVDNTNKQVNELSTKGVTVDLAIHRTQRNISVRCNKLAGVF